MIDLLRWRIAFPRAPSFASFISQFFIWETGRCFRHLPATLLDFSQCSVVDECHSQRSRLSIAYFVSCAPWPHRILPTEKWLEMACTCSSFLANVGILQLQCSSLNSPSLELFWFCCRLARASCPSASESSWQLLRVMMRNKGSSTPVFPSISSLSVLMFMDGGWSGWLLCYFLSIMFSYSSSSSTPFSFVALGEIVRRSLLVDVSSSFFWICPAPHWSLLLQ